MNKSESTTILNTVSQHYSSHFEKGKRLVIGVSGGPDSMALLYMLHKLSIPLLVSHINYRKRGAKSDADQQLVEEICSMWGIECSSVRLDPGASVRNYQEWARNQRYQIFRDLKLESESYGIAIAHHQDDQLETILLKMLRGGGFGSWKGLQVWDGELFRPLLCLSKNDILDFCETESVPYRIDESNRTDKFARNALRNQVFPIFEHFIPGWNSNLLDISNKAVISDEAFELFLLKLSNNDGIRINELKEISKELAGELIRRYMNKRLGRTPSKGQINEILNLLDSEVGRKIEISGSFSVVRDREYLIVIQAVEEAFNQVEISKYQAEKGVKFETWSLSISGDKQSSFLNVDAGRIRWPLVLRKWEPADKFEPLGLVGAQKISDHLTNRKISASKKEDSLILIDSGGTICAILYPEAAINGELGCISNRVKLTESTKQVLSIFK